MFRFRLPIPRVNVVKRGMLVPSLPKRRRRTSTWQARGEERRRAEKRAETDRLLRESVADLGRKRS